MYTDRVAVFLTIEYTESRQFDPCKRNVRSTYVYADQLRCSTVEILGEFNYFCLDNNNRFRYRPFRRWSSNTTRSRLNGVRSTTVRDDKRRL